MRRNDWLPVLVLAALLAAAVGLSVEAVADPPRSEVPAGAAALSGREIEGLLDAALDASLSDRAGNPGTTKSAVTLRSRL
jgi:hypothetical protein